MKKNLRIVSAAAAALLAVAPVAASAVSVNADSLTNVELGGTTAPATSDITVTSNVKAYTTPNTTMIDNTTGVATEFDWNGKVEGTITAAFGGQNYTANLSQNNNVTIYELKSSVKNANSLSDFKEVTPNKHGRYPLEPGKKYFVRVNSITFNFGTANANKNNLKLSGSNGVEFLYNNDNYSLNKKISKEDLVHGKSVNVNGLTTSSDVAEGYYYTNDWANKKLEGVKNAKVLRHRPGRHAANKAQVLVEYTSKNNAKHRAYLLASDVVANTNAAITKENEATNKANSNLLSNKRVVATDANGALVGNLDAFVPVVPTDMTNSESVNFFEKATNTEVTTGSLNMTANPTTHELNYYTVLQAALAKYGVRQSGDKTNSGARITTTEKDLQDQLTKAGLKLDNLGNFQAPTSFNITLTAKSDANGAEATLPITVSVANAVQTPAAQETTRTVKIMHISTIYDKNGKATHEPALRAYHTVSVVSDPVSLKDEKGNDAGKFYKLAGKDQYIKVGNVDGTKRTLKHNSYVYKSTGKRRGKTVLKKSSSVTTYGKSFMIAGHQMYRIGENKYVKKANF